MKNKTFQIKLSHLIIGGIFLLLLVFLVKCKSEKYTGNKMIFSLLNNEIVHFTDSIKRLNSSQIIKFDIPYNQNVNKLKIQLYDSLNLLENSITDFKLKSFRYSDTIFI